MVTTEDGRFNLTNLRFGNVTLLVAAPPFKEERRWVYIDPQNPVEIIEYHFIQAGDGIDETFTGTIGASDAVCASPFDPLHEGEPCHKYGPYLMPVAGGMNVQLVWRLPSLNELDSRSGGMVFVGSRVVEQRQRRGGPDVWRYRRRVIRVSRRLPGPRHSGIPTAGEFSHD
jgi:hypothetical protein